MTIKTLQIRKLTLFLLLLIVLPFNGMSQNDTVVKKSNVFTRTSFRPLPLISYNRSKGYTLGLMLIMFTQINKNDTISPASRSIAGAAITENNSWFGVVAQQLYFKRDKFRVVWALGTGKNNFQYFEAIDESGAGSYVDYNTKLNFFLSSMVYEVHNNVYAGLKYMQSYSYTTFEDPSVRPEETSNLRSLGLLINFDTRDYVYYPSKGIYGSAQLSRFADWLGSDEEYTSLTLSINHYKRLGKKKYIGFAYVCLYRNW